MVMPICLNVILHTMPILMNVIQITILIPTNFSTCFIAMHNHCALVMSISEVQPCVYNFPQLVKKNYNIQEAEHCRICGARMKSISTSSKRSCRNKEM